MVFYSNGSCRRSRGIVVFFTSSRSNTVTRICLCTDRFTAHFHYYIFIYCIKRTPSCIILCLRGYDDICQHIAHYRWYGILAWVLFSSCIYLRTFNCCFLGVLYDNRESRHHAQFTSLCPGSQIFLHRSYRLGNSTFESWDDLNRSHGR